MPRTRAARGLARIDSAALHAEIRRRREEVGRLQRYHERLLEEAASVASEIAALGGTANGAAPRGRRGRRSRNADTLVEALAKVLKGRTMRVADAADAVLKSGYRTSSKTFRTQVNIALIKSGRFKRVGRGEYRAK